MKVQNLSLLVRPLPHHARQQHPLPPPAAGLPSEHSNQDAARAQRVRMSPASQQHMHPPEFACEDVQQYMSTSQVLETCMKNCGHMFREKLPFSDLWEDLHKVAILKRKVRANGRRPFTSTACFPWYLR